MQRLGIFRSRFFWKLFLTYTALFALLGSMIGWQVYRQLKVTLTNHLKVTLEHKIDLLMPYAKDYFHDVKRRDIQPMMVDLGKQIETRITIIDAYGMVVADSEHSPVGMSDHLQRPEIIQAKNQNYGYDERQSDTLNAELMYMAHRVVNEDQIVGYVRLAWMKEQLANDLAAIRNRIILSTVIGGLVALAIAFFIARRVAIPIREMMRVCDAMRRGNYSRRVQTLTRDEIGKLGDTLNRLGIEITDKISQISLERAQLKSMLTGMVEGIIAVDNEYRVRFCNRAAYTLLGSKSDDCRGKKLGEVVGFDQLQDIARNAKEKRELVESELSLEGETISRLLEVHASFFEGIDATGIIIVLHDVTKVRRLEKMRRDFVANVSHEIKTPLTSIKGYVETLRGDASISGEMRSRFLEKIERNADRLMTLVQDILSLAQIESQEAGVPLRPTDVGVVTRYVMTAYEDLATQKNLEVKLDEFVKPLVVMADKESLQQIIDNLYSNAIRYTPHGGKVTVTLREQEQNGMIEVRDTGIGIPKKYLQRIFERFYRVDKARSREAGGTGLGLSIVKHLVSNMSGQIHVESEVGMGSKFSVALPLVR